MSDTRWYHVAAALPIAAIGWVIGVLLMAFTLALQLVIIIGAGIVFVSVTLPWLIVIKIVKSVISVASPSRAAAPLGKH